MKPISFLSLFLCIILFFSGCAPTTGLDNTSSQVSSVSSVVSTTEPSENSNPENSAQESQTNTSSANQPEAYRFSFDRVPEYTNKAYIVLNNGQPVFSKQELSAIGTETYSPLDSLGRCGVAFAVCGKEIMPKEGEKRGSISHIKPSGWVQTSYDTVDGKYLYNRCHLLGWQLSAENDNKCNLITGTRYMNTQGMLPFENMIADYIHETKNHVAYRVTPRFKNNDLVAHGVELEAYSIEDQGESVCFHVYVYNVQPGITIQYETGKSHSTQSVSSVVSSTVRNPSFTVYVTPTGKRYHYSSTCGGKNSSPSTLEKAKAMGLTPCKKCAS